ncbi:MAG: dTDP-4-dehydrorhamnose 3,5-epimerase [Vicingaceae bacterium]
MKFKEVDIEGLVVIEPKVFADDRGYFFESYNQKEFAENGIMEVFVQDNQSKSQKNVLRGLHFQKPPYAQAKLVRVVSGSVLDVAVDLRKGSSTYGKYHSEVLSAKNKKMFYMPAGFAHGFLTLEDDTIFSYKCSNGYHAKSEDSVLWNDRDLNIDWGIENPILSDKDQLAAKFNEFNTPFKL